MTTIFLFIHILTGFTALLFGTILMFIKKGGRKHVLLGRIFFWSMMFVVLSALYLAIAKNNAFLLAVGIFVFYQAFAGMRSANRKSIPGKWFDIAVLIIALINAGFMILTGNIVLIVFAIITFLLGFIDLRSYYLVSQNKDLPKLAWLARHIGMMMGSYIGTLTAFLVVNIQLANNQWIIWLGPTILFVPLMRYWTWKYTSKKSSLKPCSNIQVIFFIV